MKPNPVLEKLGYSKEDRVVIIHTDDIGMCQASISAFAELWDFGLISSGAVMVPCPWFLHVAQYCQEHPEIDMGVHLTLTSEWPTYRWGPVSSRDPETGMMDAEGYFYPTSESVQENADPEAVQVEIKAQLERALVAGIDATHVDTHMGAVAHPKLIPAYIQLALEHKLPPMIPRMDVQGYQDIGLDAGTAAFAVQMVEMLEEQGVPLLDQIAGLELDQPEERLEQAKKAFQELPPGLTHFIIHPSKDTPELRAITPDWPSRVADYQTFLNPELHQFIQEIGVQVIGYRTIRELMR